MRLIARDFRQSDANSFYQNYAANKENHQYYSDAVYSLAKVRELIKFWKKQQKNNNIIRWAIEHKQNHRVIGIVALYYDDQLIHGEICFGIGKEYWGNGFMHEILNEIFRYCFVVLQLQEIMAACDVRNERAIAVIEKCGMIFDKHVQENCTNQSVFCIYKKYNDMS